jgi:hypothetical protein
VSLVEEEYKEEDDDFKPVRGLSLDHKKKASFWLSFEASATKESELVRKNCESSCNSFCISWFCFLILGSGSFSWFWVLFSDFKVKSETP